VKLVFSSNAWSEYLEWQQSDKKILQRINDLIKDARRNPTTGLGKPKPLKHALKGYWSRRITEERRMIYRIHKESLQIVQLKYHY